MMESSRNYKNPFDDFSNSVLENENFKTTLTENTKALLDKLEENKKYWIQDDDYSVYTGTAGIAYMYHTYGKRVNDPEYTTKAVELLETCISNFSGKREIAFLTGLSGPLALMATIYDSLGKKDESHDLIIKLKSLSSKALDKSNHTSDELLYGRAGYLFSLLYVNSNISPPPIEEKLFKQIISAIITSGNIYAKSRKFETPLMFSWHDTEYLGGAHGLAGILYILLQCRKYLTEKELHHDVLSALYYLRRLKYPSGNFPSFIGSTTNKLIHWCHGVPGISMLYCLAYKVFQVPSFLETAIQCGEVIWSRGLIKKGYGICHGVAGNAYTFLYLFQETKNQKHLYRASKFAEWCMDYGVHQLRSPDRPFSLFEGLAGTIYFLIDMQSPNLAKFPGYTL